MSATFSNPGKMVIKPVHLAHVVLKTQVEQFQPMVEFYKTFLNATVTYQNHVVSFLTYDEEHHRIAIGRFPHVTPRVPTASGLVHIAFNFASLHDLALAYLQRKAHGIEPFWCVNHGLTTSMYYRDPDGNEIETQVENFESPEEATSFTMSEKFAENPIGTDFVPEDLIRRIEAGEEDKEIKKRVETGKRMAPLPIF